MTPVLSNIERKELKEKFLRYLDGRIPSWLMPSNKFFMSFNNGMKYYARKKNIALNSILEITDTQTLKSWLDNIGNNERLVYNAKKKDTKTTEGLRYYIAFLEQLTQEELIDEDYESSDELFSEGEELDSQSIRYERNLKARKICIKEKGCICAACEFDFKKKYGELGEGYIEIHHIIPISKRNGSYKLDPKNDLIPLCSNCHRMIHRKRDHVMTVEELKEHINKIS